LRKDPLLLSAAASSVKGEDDDDDAEEEGRQQPRDGGRSQDEEQDGRCCSLGEAAQVKGGKLKFYLFDLSLSFTPFLHFLLQLCTPSPESPR